MFLLGPGLGRSKGLILNYIFLGITALILMSAVACAGDAEDLLFHLADHHPTPALFAEGVAFFERLLGKSYRYLKAGNLPYEEVKEGLAAFRQKIEAGS